MAKINKEDKLRREGMAYALRIAKEKGIDGLEEELRFRNIVDAPMGITRGRLDEFMKNVKEMTVDTVGLLAAMVLHDEFGFGPKQVKQFHDRFTLKTECILGDYATWEDMQQIMKDECGLEFNIRYNNKNV